MVRAEDGGRERLSTRESIRVPCDTDDSAMIPLDVVMLAPGMAFQGDTLEKKALGGSETAALCMAREMAKLGHKVRVFSNCETPGEYDKVIYMPAASWSQYSQPVPHESNIVQRTPEAFKSHLQSR